MLVNDVTMVQRKGSKEVLKDLPFHNGIITHKLPHRLHQQAVH